MKYIYIIFLVFTFLSCNNKEKVENRKNTDNIVEDVESKKKIYRSEIDSLSNEIEQLKQKRTQLSTKKEIAKADIYRKVQNASLDHIIIGVNNLDEISSIVLQKLGFTIKKGNRHKEGITNIFIEFPDTSELEFVQIINPKSNLAQSYFNKLQHKEFGLKFAMRTNQIENLSKNFMLTNFPFKQLNKNNSYITLSASDTNSHYPFFFIQYDDISHNYSSNIRFMGLQSVWVSTKNIRETIKQFSNFGFKLIDTVSIKNIEHKTAWMKNNKFSLIVIEDNHRGIKGISIGVKDIDVLLRKFKHDIKKNAEIINNKRGRSIILEPQITHSIWFEFIE